MFKRARIAIAVMAVCGSTAAAAQAQDVTLSLGAPTLIGKVAVVEPVTMSCSGFDPSLVVFGQGVTVSVQQASKGKIAHGSAMGGPAAEFACDGGQNTFPVVISADPSGPPFHGGSAVFTAFGSVQAGTPCGFGGFCPPFEFASASTGAASLKLH
jgi:hypothetical protein